MDTRLSIPSQLAATVLGTVAHDLRHPLNLISMTTQLLIEVDPPPARRAELLRGTKRAEPAGSWNDVYFTLPLAQSTELAASA